MIDNRGLKFSNKENLRPFKILAHFEEKRVYYISTADKNTAVPNKVTPADTQSNFSYLALQFQMQTVVFDMGEVLFRRLLFIISACMRFLYVRFT